MVAVRLLLLVAFFTGLCITAAEAQQGGPGWLDPQRVVSNSLSSANSVTQMNLATAYSACSAAVSGTRTGGTLTFEQSNELAATGLGHTSRQTAEAPVVTTATSAFFGTDLRCSGRRGFQS